MSRDTHIRRQSPRSAARRPAVGLRRVTHRSRGHEGGAALQTAGVILPYLSNPFFAQIAHFCQKALDRVGYSAILASSDDIPETEYGAVERLFAMGVRGLIFITTAHTSDKVFRTISERGIPVVFCDRLPRFVSVFDSVTVDCRSGIQTAVDYLALLGHRDIGFLKGLPGTSTAAARLEAFEQAMKLDDLVVDRSLLFQGDYRQPSGCRCADELIAMNPKTRPTAILAANDLMAIGLMQRLQQESGTRISVPDELSIIGFDGIELSKWVYPALTTVEQPLEQLVFRASELLVRRMEERLSGMPPAPVEHETLKATLRPRGTVATPVVRETRRLRRGGVRRR